MDRATTVSDALKRQRLLAAQAIRKANDISPQTVRHIREQCSPAAQVNSVALYASPTASNKTASPQQKSLNITELEEEKTIHIATTPRKFTFEPKEMAARSTMSQQSQPSATATTAGKTNPSKFLSAGIEEILASSFADNIRCMGLSLRETAASVHADFDGDGQLANMSLPRTADMSKLSCDSLSSLPSGVRPTMGKKEPGTGKIGQSNKDPWEISQPAFESSWMKDKINELSQMEECSFQSGDHMASRLLEDEMAWEQENADIPEMNAKQRQISPVKGIRKPQLKDHVDFSCFSGYLAQEDDISRLYDESTTNNEGSVCSVGHYFNKMSDDLNDMVGREQSPPQRRPLPLIDVTNDIESPKSPTKVYGGSKGGQSGGKENKENSLSVSCIVKAITSIDLEDSPHNFINKLKQVQRTKSEQLAASSGGGEQTMFAALPKSNSDLSAGTHASHPTRAKQPRSSSVHSAGFQQHSRPAANYQQSDTLSFSESMFDDSSSTMPVLPHSKTSSPKAAENGASQQSWQNDETEPLTPLPETKKKALAVTAADTFRVSTATKLSEEHMDLPSIPRIQETRPACQKNVFGDRPIAKPNRKRRSNSTTRQELVGGKREELAVATSNLRSKSPSNRAELKAVSATSYEQQVLQRKNSGSNISYQTTPKISHQRKPVPSEVAFSRETARKSYLSPEPRAASRSPYSSPKGDAGRSSEGYDEVADKYSLRVPGALAPSRSASQCSGSTEWIHRSEGTLPLKATHSELSWGSTRLRKSEKKTMQIKNTSNRKLLVKAVIVGPGFQLCGTEQSGLLTLQSQECRTITVDFCPTVIGPAIGALSFHPPNDLYIQRVVSLFGYGGEASIKIEGIQKGPSGPFLELGSARNLGRPLEKSFSLYNKGSLPAFARIGIDKKGLDQALLATAVYVQPQRTIIPPNSYAHIKVVFKPRRQEIAKILQKQVEVLSITNLHILWGDEPTRHRIRKNIALAKQNKLVDPKMGALESICNPFTEEDELDGLDAFCEHVFDTIHELFLTFREYELVLTVDRALDDTMLDLSMADGNTTLFKTMYASSEVGSSPRVVDDMLSPALAQECPGQSREQGTGPPVAASGSASALAGMHKRDSGESWSVRPTMLEFYPSTERTKQFVIKSNFYTAQYFELNSNYRQLFRLSPCEGYIRPGQEVVVNVSLQHLQPIGTIGTNQQQPSIFVVVYIENEKISIPVLIHYGH